MTISLSKKVIFFLSGCKIFKVLSFFLYMYRLTLKDNALCY